MFELTLEQVPDFCNEKPRDEWYKRYQKWLWERGLSVVTFHTSQKALREDWLKGCFVIVSGLNSDGVRHCMIYCDGKPFHDPNKTCTGIIPDCVDIIFPKEPQCSTVI